MIAIAWSNGLIHRARSWQKLMDKVRADQWHQFTEDEFRMAMAKRAIVWSGTEIDPFGSPREFFQELYRAKMIVFLDKDLTFL